MHTRAKVRFQSLRHAPEYASELAHWLHLERQRFGAAGTEAEGLDRLQAEYENSANLPHTKIARLDNQLLGAVTLMQFYGPLAQAGAPWLTNLWVHPEWRKRGIGRALCERVCELARAQNFAQLQLFTYDQAAFYRAMGWVEVREAEITGRRCTIMAFAL